MLMHTKPASGWIKMSGGLMYAVGEEKLPCGRVNLSLECPAA